MKHGDFRPYIEGRDNNGNQNTHPVAISGHVKNNKPTIIYHSGFNGAPDGVIGQAVYETAQNNDCRIVAFNSVEPNYNGPNEYLDFRRAIEVSKSLINFAAQEQSENLIFVMNSWGALPITLAIKELGIEPIGVHGINANLHAHSLFKDFMAQNIQAGIVEKQRYNDGEIVQVPYLNNQDIRITRAFIEAGIHHGIDTNSISTQAYSCFEQATGDEFVSHEQAINLAKAYSLNRKSVKLRIDDHSMGLHIPEIQNTLQTIIDRGTIHIRTRNMA